MCFSEKLEKESAGYAEEHGYVHVGYKVVTNIGPLLMPWYVLEAVSMTITDFDSHMSRGIHIVRDERNRALRVYLTTIDFSIKLLQSIFDGDKVAVFPPRQMVEDHGHGFHVASSEEAAAGRNGNPFGARRMARPKDKPLFKHIYALPPDVDLEMPIEVEYYYEINPPGAMVTVLVPELAVDETNHVHAMMVIPPGEKETAADIEACNQWNARARQETPEFVRRQLEGKIDQTSWKMLPDGSYFAALDPGHPDGDRHVVHTTGRPAGADSLRTQVSEPHATSRQDRESADRIAAAVTAAQPSGADYLT